jgi:hypothetical protein
MSACLFVVIGAGASYDSTSPDNLGSSGVGAQQGADRVILPQHLRPPLVTELFAPRFAGILNKYPIAQMAASDIRRQTQESVAIEDYLRERYRDSDDDLDRRKFHAVHWYLQDLLWCVSNFYTSHPDNYDRLVTGCLRLPEVVFITLNYDTLLDDRLRVVAPVDDLDGYVSPDRSWGLVKLHGSVDWGLPIWSPAFNDQRLISNPPADVKTGGEISLRPSRSIDDVRLQKDHHGAVEQVYYPAMSVPVGTRDAFSCPPGHVDHVRRRLAEQDALDVLMLGYSALDEEVLTLFQESGRPLRSLCAVNANRDTAQLPFERVAGLFGEPVHGEVYERAFSDFVGTEDFDRYLGRLERWRA